MLLGLSTKAHLVDTDIHTCTHVYAHTHTCEKNHVSKQATSDPSEILTTLLVMFQVKDIVAVVSYDIEMI